MVFRRFKAAETKHMSVKNVIVIELLKIENKDLPSILREYEYLRKQVSELEFKRIRLEEEIQALNYTKAQTSISLTTIRSDSAKEMSRLLDLRQQAAEQEALNFQNIDKEYIKITKIQGSKVTRYSYKGIILLVFLFIH